MKNEIIEVKVEKVDGVLVTTSNRVAKELGVNHKDLLEKIDGYAEKFTKAESSALVEEFYIPSTYKVEGNFKTYRNYLITEKGVAQLIGGYSAAVPRAFELNVAYINKFEEMKNKLKTNNLPTTYLEALEQLVITEKARLELEAKNEQLVVENKQKEQIINEQKPKATYYDEVLKSTNTVTISQIAKDYGMSGQQLNSLLHDLGVQYKSGGQWLLYSKYQKFGYTKSETFVNKSGFSKLNTKWTQTGRLFLYDLLKSNDILPMIDRENQESEI